MVRHMQTPPKQIAPSPFSNSSNLLKSLLRLCFLCGSKCSSSSDEDNEEEDVESLLWTACLRLQTNKYKIEADTK